MMYAKYNAASLSPPSRAKSLFEIYMLRAILHIRTGVHAVTRMHVLQTGAVNRALNTPNGTQPIETQSN